jgi:hypothetical protein
MGREGIVSVAGEKSGRRGIEAGRVTWVCVGSGTIE